MLENNTTPHGLAKRKSGTTNGSGKATSTIIISILNNYGWCLNSLKLGFLQSNKKMKTIHPNYQNPFILWPTIMIIIRILKIILIFFSKAAMMKGWPKRPFHFKILVGSIHVHWLKVSINLICFVFVLKSFK